MNIETAVLEVSISDETNREVRLLAKRTNTTLGNTVEDLLRSGILRRYQQFPNLLGGEDDDWMKESPDV